RARRWGAANDGGSPASARKISLPAATDKTATMNLGEARHDVAGRGTASQAGTHTPERTNPWFPQTLHNSDGDRVSGSHDSTVHRARSGKASRTPGRSNMPPPS